MLCARESSFFWLGLRTKKGISLSFIVFFFLLLSFYSFDSMYGHPPPSKKLEGEGRTKPYSGIKQSPAFHSSFTVHFDNPVDSFYFLLKEFLFLLQSFSLFIQLVFLSVEKNIICGGICCRGGWLYFSPSVV